MTNIGWATLSVIPSAKGFGAALSKQVEPDLKAAGVAGGNAMGDGLLAAAKKIAGPLAAAFGATQIAGAFLSSMRAAAEDDRAVRSLGQTLANFGRGGQLDGVEATISRLSLMSGIADDELRPAFQQVFTATGSVTKATDSLGLALDIAAGSGKSVSEVTSALSKAYLGNTSILSRMNIGLDKTIVASGDMNAITAELARKFGGQAKTAASTWAGQLDRVQVAASEASETVGYSLLKAVDKFSKALGGSDGAVDGITQMGNGLAGLITDLSNFTTAIISARNAGAEAAKQDEYSQDSYRKTAQAIPVVGAWLVWLSQRNEDNARATGKANENMAGYSAAIAAYDPVASSAWAAQQRLKEETEQTGNAFAISAKQVITLQDALDSLNGRSRGVMGASSALAAKWAELGTMGPTKTVGQKRHQVTDQYGRTRWVSSTEHDVQMPFVPAVKGGAFDLSRAGGRQGSDFITAAAQAAEGKALALANIGQYDRATAVLDRNRRRIAGLLDSWGIANPKAMAADVLSTPPWLGQIGANGRQMQTGPGHTTYNIDMHVDEIKSWDQMMKLAKEKAELEALSHGQSSSWWRP